MKGRCPYCRGSLAEPLDTVRVCKRCGVFWNSKGEILVWGKKGPDFIEPGILVIKDERES